MRIIIEFVNSVTGLVVAISGLLGALVSLATVIKRFRKRFGTHRKASDIQKSRKITPQNTHIVRGLIYTALGVIVFLVVETARSFPEVLGISFARQSTLIKAFHRLDDEKWVQAEQMANKVIGEFAGQAIIEQEKLELAKVPMPLIGKVPQELQDAIYARGILNDVGASYFIKGRALEHLGRFGEARVAYQKAAILTYARIWDPHGFFWSPTEASLGRLLTLPP